MEGFGRIVKNYAFVFGWYIPDMGGESSLPTSQVVFKVGN